MTRDSVVLAVVSFHTEWGKKEKNLKRILEYSEQAAARGAELIVFPEMALTGYEDEETKTRQDKMQTRMAETMSGAAIRRLIECAKKNDIYIVLGMPERDPDIEDRIYNAAVMLGSDGSIQTYRKIHLPNSEPDWAVCGDKIGVFASPWGPIGIGICYDVYQFEEVTRYAAAKGARLMINTTACREEGRSASVVQTEIESVAWYNFIPIVSANLAGRELKNTFFGRSHIIQFGIEDQIMYCAGHPFGSTDGGNEEMCMAVLDLEEAERKRLSADEFRDNYNPELYRKLYAELII